MNKQILVRNLKPGDILPSNIMSPRAVVIGTAGDPTPMITLKLAELGACATEGCFIFTRWHQDSKVDIEQSDLTPAQQYGDELLLAVKRYEQDLHGQSFGATSAEVRVVKESLSAVRLLIEKIEPSNPLTLDDTIEMLRRVQAGPKIIGPKLAADIESLLNRVK